MEIEVLEALYALIDNIKNSSMYQEYKHLEKQIMEKYSFEIEAFNKAKDEYNMALGYGEYYPGMKEIKAKLLKCKENLYNKEEMLLYKKLELQIDLELKKLNDEIKKVIMGWLLMVKRRSLIVYFKNENFLKNIDSSVNVAYVSKKRKYAVIYMDENKLKGIRINLQRTKGVLDVIESKAPLEAF